MSGTEANSKGVTIRSSRTSLWGSSLSGDPGRAVSTLRWFSCCFKSLPQQAGNARSAGESCPSLFPGLLAGWEGSLPRLDESLRKPNRFWNQNWESRPPAGPACRNLTPSVLWSRPSSAAPAAHLSQVSTGLAGCEHRVLNNPLAPTTPSRSWSRNSGLEEEGGGGWVGLTKE